MIEGGGIPASGELYSHPDTYKTIYGNEYWGKKKESLGIEDGVKFIHNNTNFSIKLIPYKDTFKIIIEKKTTDKVKFSILYGGDSISHIVKGKVSFSFFLSKKDTNNQIQVKLQNVD